LTEVVLTASQFDSLLSCLSSVVEKVSLQVEWLQFLSGVVIGLACGIGLVLSWRRLA
jgi:hypothetical protein